jgi:hypothetical protein
MFILAGINMAFDQILFNVRKKFIDTGVLTAGEGGNILFRRHLWDGV